LNQPHYVFVFQLRENHAGRAMDHDALRSDTVKIKNMLMREIESAGHQALVSTRLDRVHALIPATFLQNNRGSVKEFGETFVAKVKPALKSADIVLGISNLCQNMQQFSAGFKEANKAIEICKIKKNASSVVMAADLGFLGLLLDARKPEELLSFADSLIGPLLEYDANKGSELLKTVYTYLENECNLYKTARILNVSISGMRYRINRIRELTGLDLTVSSTRYDIHLAVDIYLALGKLQF
jgi:DNA-binding PucR family transcriptional regulator